MKFTFLPLQESHLKQLFIWLNTDAVAAWYGKGEGLDQYENIVRKFLPKTQPESKTLGFIICHDSNQIGYIQTYRICDYPEYNQYVGVDDHAVGIDLFIGESAYLHKGFGSQILHQFLDDIAFQLPEIDCCIIGPEPKNTSAIRSYEKVGFSYWKTIKQANEMEPEYLMWLKKEY